MIVQGDHQVVQQQQEEAVAAPPRHLRRVGSCRLLGSQGPGGGSAGGSRGGGALNLWGFFKVIYCLYFLYLCAFILDTFLFFLNIFFGV